MRYTIVLLPAPSVSQTLIQLARAISIDVGLKAKYLLSDNAENLSIPHASIIQCRIGVGG